MKPLSILLCTAIFFFITVAAMAQTVKNYEAQWKIVDGIIQKKNLPQSALKEVRKI